MSKPVVAVPADFKVVDGYNWHATPDQYVNAALKEIK